MWPERENLLLISVRRTYSVVSPEFFLDWIFCPGAVMQPFVTGTSILIDRTALLCKQHEPVQLTAEPGASLRDKVLFFTEAEL